MIGGNALVEEADMGLFRLADPDSVVVLQDGPVGRLVVRLLELELYHALVHVLPRHLLTLFTMTTFSSTS